MRGYTAPYARTFAPSPLYLYEKFRTKTIVRKVILPEKRFPGSEKACVLKRKVAKIRFLPKNDPFWCKNVRGIQI